MTQETLKLALDALENHTAIKHPQQIHYRDKAIAAIKEALAQPEQSHRDGYWCVDLTCNKCYSADFRFKHTTPPQRTEQEPVAWRTFDGEGGYDYCSYEDNESYADDWSKRNPNHAGWVDKLYTHSQLEPPTVDVRILQAVSDEYNAWIRAHAAGMGYDDFLIQRLAAHGIKENT